MANESPEPEPAAATVPDETATCETVVANPAALERQRALLRNDRLPAGHAIGRYIVLRAIGEGGMGMVYAAFDPKLDRKIALKLLRPDRHKAAIDHKKASARLLREAQVMAKIAHRNVVSVFDVGVHEGKVFMAMEFVDGRSLGRWLREQKEATWQQVVDLFLQAGSGLAALHSAGLVHRDFKPVNVMVGDNGRVCVVDFGLARRSDSPSDEAPDPLGSGELTPEEQNLVGADIPVGPVTGIGRVTGTPRYMAPEQFRGRSMDNRTDQFSFAMSLYEALYGHHPFRDEDSDDYRAAVVGGQLRPPPADTAVPARVQRVLARSLQPSIEARYPSMDELLAALGNATNSRRRAVTLAAMLAVALCMLGLAALYFRGDNPPACRGAGQRWDGVWDAERKQELQRVFAATNVPYANAAWTTTETVIDAYVTTWIDTHRDACEATRVRQEQSAELMDRRMLCLDTRREEAKAFLALLQEADAELVGRAVEASHALSSVAHCSQLSLLTAASQPPSDAATRAAVGDVRARLARARAQHHAGMYDQALALATKASRDARAADYPPVEAEALYLLGDLHELATESEKALLAAYRTAEQAKDDGLRVYIAANLVYAVGYQQARYREGALWGELAAAALARIGGHDDAEATLHLHLAAMLHGQGDDEAALDHVDRGLALLESMHGPEHSDVASALSNRGLLLAALKRFDEALAVTRQELALTTRLHGPAHPGVAASHNNLALILAATGKADDSLSHLQSALQIWEEALGPSHADVALALGNIAEWHDTRGSLEVALEFHRRALTTWESALGPEDQEVAFALAAVGDLLHRLGRNGEAVPPLERALAIHETLGNARAAADTRFALARVLWSARQRTRARRLAVAATAGYRSVGDEAADELAEVTRWLAASR